MKTILVLMDTLRRNELPCYNPSSCVKTPNLDEFAEESTIFDNHWIGSAPCMPARRDILTGRLNFLERSWGPIEPFDVTLPELLRSHGYFTHITTDHCHYLRTGGEGYLQLFNTWDYHRGQEGDPWVSRIDEPFNMPETFYGRVREQYQKNRLMWPSEKDMPSPKTFSSACEWLDVNGTNENYFLMVEAFDPHEPFDVPDTYMDLYPSDDDLDREYYEIPEYKRVSEAGIPKNAVNYIQRRYRALISMTDHWFGTLIKKIKEIGTFEETLIIVTTDHGYFLGERDFLGKNYMPLFNELAHLPLLIRYPHSELNGIHLSQLTQAIDIMPTILDYVGIKVPDTVRGTSLKQLFSDPSGSTRSSALFGYHAMAVNITDGRYTYFRVPVPSNKPCYEYAAIPTTIRKILGIDCPEKIEMGRFISRTMYPVYKIPVCKPSIIDQSNDPLKEISHHMLFDLQNDYAQTKNLAGSCQILEQKMIDLLDKALLDNDAPAEQWERLGLKS